jgi:hypothetical protein
VLAKLSAPSTAALLAGGALALVARLAAIRFGLQLPHPRWLSRTAVAGEEPS